MDSKSTKSIDDISLSCDESISNKSNTDDECEDSSPDIEVLNVYSDNDEELLLEKEIEEKKKILKCKREELRDRLVSYKLMQFSASSNISNLHSVPSKQTPQKTEFKVPASPTPADSTTPSSPQSSCTDAFNPGPVAAMFNEHEYGFGDEDLAMAIQASLDEMTKIQVVQRLSPPPEDGPLASGLAGNSQTGSANQSYAEAVPGSSRSSEPFTAVNPLRRWNTIQPGTETQNQHREAGSDIQEIDLVQEDFMEGDRYVGDKGKRPLSGKYSYKKRSKSSQVDSNEHPSGSSFPKDDRSVE